MLIWFTKYSFKDILFFNVFSITSPADLILPDLRISLSYNFLFSSFAFEDKWESKVFSKSILFSFCNKSEVSFKFSQIFGFMFSLSRSLFCDNSFFSCKNGFSICALSINSVSSMLVSCNNLIACCNWGVIINDWFCLIFSCCANFISTSTFFYFVSEEKKAGILGKSKIIIWQKKMTKKWLRMNFKLLKNKVVTIGFYCFIVYYF